MEPMSEHVTLTVTSLEDLWKLQGELNARCGMDTVKMGKWINSPPDGSAMSAAKHAGVMLHQYLNALRSETQELEDCLAWKHWYKEARDGNQFILKDLQNARVEVIDLLFFWMSLTQILGLTPSDVYRLYAKKLGINHKRQDEDRSQADHGDHEDENREVV